MIDAYKMDGPLLYLQNRNRTTGVVRLRNAHRWKGAQFRVLHPKWGLQAKAERASLRCHNRGGTAQALARIRPAGCTTGVRGTTSLCNRRTSVRIRYTGHLSIPSIKCASPPSFRCHLSFDSHLRKPSFPSYTSTSSHNLFFEFDLESNLWRSTTYRSHLAVPTLPQISGLPLLQLWNC